MGWPCLLLCCCCNMTRFPSCSLQVMLNEKLSGGEQTVCHFLNFSSEFKFIHPIFGQVSERVCVYIVCYCVSPAESRHNKRNTFII